MTIGLFAALLLFCALALWQPPALAFISMFLPFESPGVGAALLAWQKQIVPVGYMGYVLAVAIIFIRLWRRRNRSYSSRRLYRVGLLAVGTGAWMIVCIIATGGSKFQAANLVITDGIPGLLFALAYYNNRTARGLLVGAIFVHLVIGCGMIVFPNSPLAVLRRSDVVQALLPNVWALETTNLKDGVQFWSPVQFAVYAAVGLLLGAYMLLYNRDVRVKLFGGALAVLGVAGTFFTIERAIWMGILLGLLMLAYPITRRQIGRIAYGCLLMAVGAGLWMLFVQADSPGLAILRGHFLQIAGDSYRIPAALRSFDILLTRPLFGVEGSVPAAVDLAGGLVHQSFYFYAVLYGLPAGVFSLILTWWAASCVLGKCKTACVPGFAREDYYLVRALGLVVVCMALTNGMSGGAVGWICLGFVCLPWAYRAPRRQRVRSYPRFGAGRSIRPNITGGAKVEW